MRLVPYSRSLALSLAVAALGCSSSAADTTAIVRPELVQVSPEDFMGSVVCGREAGQARSYVATLFDVTPPANAQLPDAGDALSNDARHPGFQLPSSPPTPCRQPAAFSYVISGHLYLAQVDAYDRPSQAEIDGELGAGGATGEDQPNVITPTTPGARLQLDANGERVSPRWNASCGAYPQSLVMDGGSYVPVGGAPSKNDIAADEAGAGGQPNLDGVVSYDGLTQTAHDCRGGLQPVEN